MKKPRIFWVRVVGEDRWEVSLRALDARDAAARFVHQQRIAGIDAIEVVEAKILGHREGGVFRTTDLPAAAELPDIVEAEDRRVGLTLVGVGAALVALAWFGPTREGAPVSSRGLLTAIGLSVVGWGLTDLSRVRAGKRAPNSERSDSP